MDGLIAIDSRQKSAEHSKKKKKKKKGGHNSISHLNKYATSTYNFRFSNPMSLVPYIPLGREATIAWMLEIASMHASLILFRIHPIYKF